MSRWLLFAGLAAVVALTAGREDRSLFDDCRAYPVVKSFTANTKTNDSCTFKLPFFQCGGYCLTTAEINSKGVRRQPDGMYEIIPKVDCECCEPIKPKKEFLPAGTIDCENSELKWDKDFTLTVFDQCICRRCRSPAVVSQ